MTDRQQRIMEAGLYLFATKGYRATSTNEVAKKAEVSEGLIFRHFKNKEGLLKAILQEGEEKVKQLYDDIIGHQDPTALINAFLELPFKVPASEHTFWKLLFALKWETGADSTKRTQSIKAALTRAFKKLSYPNAEMEAQFLIFYMDGLVTAIVKGEMKASPDIKNFLQSKY